MDSTEWQISQRFKNEAQHSQNHNIAHVDAQNFDMIQPLLKK